MNSALISEGSTLVKELCEKHNVTPIYIAFHGSQAYGYAKETSDNDILFIYKRPLKDYFRTDSLPTEIKHSELDVKGWDIQKFLSILVKDGWNAHEALHCPNITFGNSSEELIHKILEFANVQINCNKIARTMICCASRDFDKADTNDNVRKLKYFLSSSRMILSTLHLLRYETSPPISYDRLVKTCLRGNLLDEYKIFGDNEFTLRTLQMFKAARTSNNEDLIDIDMLNAFIINFKEIHYKLIEEVKTLKFKEVSEETKEKANSLLQEYILEN